MMNPEAAAQLLYEAARRGVPQGFGFTDNGTATCAWGVLLRATPGHHREVAKHFDLLSPAWIACPLCGVTITGNLFVVLHLNDIHLLPFTMIAWILQQGLCAAPTAPPVDFARLMAWAESLNLPAEPDAVDGDQGVATRR